MAKKTVSLNGEIVKKSNTVARAIWAINSVYEPRLVALVASKVHKDDEDFFDYEIPVKELLGEKPDGRSYEIVKSVIQNLVGRKVEIPRPRGVYGAATIFSYCEYDSRNGIISCRFDKSMKPHYLNLSKQFTLYSLEEFLALPSIYSQRLYEILKSWEKKPAVQIEIVTLHKILNVPESLQKNFKDFRRRVLDKAEKDIHERTTLKYEWEGIKKGRKITAINFIFDKKRAKKAADKKKQTKQTKESQHRNKYGKLAINCFNDHKKAASMCENDNKPQACELCKEMFPTLINHALI